MNLSPHQLLIALAALGVLQAAIALGFVVWVGRVERRIGALERRLPPAS